MSRKVTEQEIADARATIAPFIPLGMAIVFAVVNCVRQGVTYSQQLEDSIMILTKAIVESDKF